MYNTTADYRSNIYGDERTMRGRVTFHLAPSTLVGDSATVTSSAQFALSNREQTDDNVRQNTYRLATWETDRTRLDGSFTFASDEASERGHVGFVSDALSDAAREFSSPPFVQLTFTKNHTAAGVTVTFDTDLNEYASDFTITVLDATNAVIYSQSFADNTDSQVLMLAPIADFRKINVTVYKWSHAEQRARITEIDVGALLVYDDDKLIRFNMTEELEPTGSTLVIPEFEFTIDNTSKEFDMFNPSGVYANLEQRQEIVPELGLQLNNRIEWIPLGLFLLFEWRSDTGSMTATFRGRSKIDLLNDIEYERTSGSSITLAALIQDILNQANISAYSIDPALDAILTNGITDKRPAREALQLAAIAGCANIRLTRDNMLRFDVSRESTVRDNLTYEECWLEPQIELLKPTKKVTVGYYTSLYVSGGDVAAVQPNVESGDSIVLSPNPFINTAVRAQAVANWILSRSNERKKFSVEYRGNPALELYDLVTIENPYLTDAGVHLTKIELFYEGYLNSRIEGRKN